MRTNSLRLRELGLPISFDLLEYLYNLSGGPETADTDLKDLVDVYCMHDAEILTNVGI